MLLWNLPILFRDPLFFVFLVTGTVVALLVAITVHEFSHALIAFRLGDSTALRLGRLSLNPLAHLDPAGTVLLFLVGFGWGKPVPVNPYFLTGGARAGMAVVALAGPLSNLLTAAVFALPVRLGVMAWHSPFSYRLFAQVNPQWLIADIIGLIVFYNLILAAFNLIPLAPLDGFKVALGILPKEISSSYAKLEQYGPAILFAVIGLGYFTDLNVLWGVLGPLVNAFAFLLVGRAL